MKNPYLVSSSMWKNRAFPVWSRTKQECPLTTSIQHGTGSPSDRQQKEIKGIHIGREEVKLPLYVDAMILYTENLIIKKLLELINKFSKVTGYKIDVQKLHYNTPVMKLQKEKLRNHSHLQLHQKQ